ncbi:nitrate reductase associated protein [Nodosilinea sp. LEGE 07088]|uniref:nitrate reductase associated protein n=1 Tax=Nodosilinea sp. LEGE 07088 TaxID=2777968 RepID=UPI0018825B22|nr:nitrate reductase associated protein [Nodosilinea sp. LEGE 07088]MBE9136693.1 nitrate reductase associated protein [Nodosilinea sp. LEGE 07088]
MTQTSDAWENQDFFQFEADFVDSLRCIPMQVRMKLDTCGVKLKLEHWHRFSHGDRDRITQLPCQDGESAAAYAEAVQALVQQVQGKPASTLAIDPHPPWQDDTKIPAEVQTKALELGVALSLAQWQGLKPLQRFALIKLSRSSHENRNFYPALVEFGLVEE